MNIDIAYGLGFNKINGLGPVKIYGIWKYFGTLKNAWEADISEFRNILNLTETNIEQIQSSRNHIVPEKEFYSIEKKKVGILSLMDEDYPDILRTITDPPFILFYKGKYSKRNFDKTVGIVGTRNPSDYGKKIAFSIGSDLSGLGINVISGLALGIDTDAHKGALTKGITTAVLGCGVDIIYPNSNARLYSEIVEKGIIISEYEPGTSPDSWRFPARNRIISGLSKGVVIVEAGERSGALITTDFATEQGREVMAIPGDIFNPMSKGPNNLIKQGALIITDLRDIIDNLNWKVELDDNKIKIKSEKIEQLNLSPAEREVFLVLNEIPQHLDNILNKVSLPLADITSNLIMLELKQLIKQLPGKLFVKV